jgi:hypothetical protein
MHPSVGLQRSMGRSPLTHASLHVVMFVGLSQDTRQTAKMAVAAKMIAPKDLMMPSFMPNGYTGPV